MESFFLACFVFGALFTAASVALGLAGAGGHGGHIGDGGHVGGHVGDGGADLGAPGHAGHVDTGQAGDTSPADRLGAMAGRSRLPLLNLSSGLAFLTWFGAAGYLLLQFAGWPPLAAVAAAAVAGGVGALAIASFLAKVLAGERVMDPRDYRLEGTIARVTVSIPTQGIGEIVFAKVGTRRSEAARSRQDRPIPRGAEVVIMGYERGVAIVEPWNELIGSTEPDLPGPGATPTGSDN